MQLQSPFATDNLNKAYLVDCLQHAVTTPDAAIEQAIDTSI